MKKTYLQKISAIMLSAAMLTGCGNGAIENSLEPSTQAKASFDYEDVEYSQNIAFFEAQYQFAVDLLRSALKNNAEENMMLSSYSMSMALAMVGNGAANDTREEFEQVLGQGKITLDDMNACYKDWRINQPDSKNCKLNTANGIWIDNTIQGIKDDFLVRNDVFFKASAFQTDICSKTVDEVNQFVKKNTDGMIPNMLDSMDADALIVLLNAVYFDAKWAEPFKKEDTISALFEGVRGGETVQMMTSDEYDYLEQDGAVGFLKSYDGSYAFVGILPPEEMTVAEYAETLTGESLREMLLNRKSYKVSVRLPKFKNETDLNMNDILGDMGLKAMFTESADFSALAETPLHFDYVKHKTVIEMNEDETKATAATDAVESCAESSDSGLCVFLNRPFIYIIMDMDAKIPVFIGTMQQAS